MTCLSVNARKVIGRRSADPVYPSHVKSRNRLSIKEGEPGSWRQGYLEDGVNERYTNIPLSYRMFDPKWKAIWLFKLQGLC